MKLYKCRKGASLEIVMLVITVCFVAFVFGFALMLPESVVSDSKGIITQMFTEAKSGFIFSGDTEYIIVLDERIEHEVMRDQFMSLHVGDTVRVWVTLGSTYRRTNITILEKE